MPQKVRQLIAQLERAGFTQVRQTGSHRTFKHAQGESLTLSGKEGHDAKPYQEKAVSAAIARAIAK